MKKWYLSKIFWASILAVVNVIIRAEMGLVMTTEAEVALLGLIVIILRAITKEELEWKF